MFFDSLLFHHSLVRHLPGKSGSHRESLWFPLASLINFIFHQKKNRYFDYKHSSLLSTRNMDTMWRGTKGQESIEMARGRSQRIMNGCLRLPFRTEMRMNIPKPQTLVCGNIWWAWRLNHDGMYMKGTMVCFVPLIAGQFRFSLFMPQEKTVPWRFKKTNRQAV